MRVEAGEQVVYDGTVYVALQGHDTQADDIPIDGTMCATFTNGASQNEMWRFPEFWVHEHLDDEPGGS